MKAPLSAFVAFADRARRRAGLDLNPMRRGVDRLQSAAGLTLILVFLVVAPWASLAVGGAVYHAGLRAERAESAQRHPVTARVADSHGTADHSAKTAVQATWRDTRGVLHTGAYDGTFSEVGTKTTIWVDQANHVVRPPRTHPQTVTDAVLAGLGTALATMTVLTTAYAVLRRRLDRSRYRLWEADWARADLRWKRRGSHPEQG